MDRVLYVTKSLCPTCLKVIPAQVVEQDGQVYMKKSCPQHGQTQTVIWQDSGERYLSWLEAGGFTPGQAPDHCPQRCGLCDSHVRRTCTAALMVTNRCNVHCPVCFTSAQEGARYDPTLEELAQLMERYRAQAGEGAPLEFCGGEPTTREDLPQLASMARQMGFDYIQLNTNGIRLAQEPDYAKKLKESGITTAYLGFDGVTSGPYFHKYSRDLLEIKRKAVEHCAEAQLAVVLVPCIIPGVNDGELGGIIQFAKEHMPTVKGVYFQPISYFGVYPEQQRKRITIPQVLRCLEEQTQGEVKVRDFLPGACEHPQCSFGGYFMVDREGKLRAVTRFHNLSPKEHPEQGVREATKHNWQWNERRYLTIGGMAFQDVWNVDLQRLQRCTIHIIGREEGMVPLCSKYLTAEDGTRLFDHIN
jgi:uncharacterized radical SAM superfamily Fe-S cluster-containing enzyme